MTITNSKETPNERFRRLATSRTNATIEKLILLGNLSDRRNYQYTDDEINKIFAAINNTLKDTKAKFITTKRGFKL
jgi:hypothetical protein